MSNFLKDAFNLEGLAQGGLVGTAINKLFGMEGTPIWKGGGSVVGGLIHSLGRDSKKKKGGSLMQGLHGMKQQPGGMGQGFDPQQAYQYPDNGIDPGFTRPQRRPWQPPTGPGGMY